MQKKSTKVQSDDGESSIVSEKCFISFNQNHAQIVVKTNVSKVMSLIQFKIL